MSACPTAGDEQHALLLSRGDPDQRMNINARYHAPARSVTAAFAGDRPAITRFCTLYWHDYTCLGYPFPPECANASGSAAAAVRRARRDAAQDARLCQGPTPEGGDISGRR